MVATFPYTIFLAILEPLAVDRTKIVTYVLSDYVPNGNGGGGDPMQESMQRSQDFLLAGTREDREVTCSVQRGLASEANEYFEFGRFEGLITHFHRSLHALIDGEVH
jgi:hypothetical protein